MHLSWGKIVALPFILWWLTLQLVDHASGDGWSDAWLRLRGTSNTSLKLVAMFWVVFGTATLPWRLSVASLAVAVSLLYPPEYGITILADLLALLGIGSALCLFGRFLNLKLVSADYENRRRAGLGSLFVLCTLFAVISISFGKVSWPNFQVGDWKRLVYAMMYLAATQVLLGSCLLPLALYLVFGVRNIRRAFFAAAVTGIAIISTVAAHNLLMWLTVGITNTVASVEISLTVLLFLVSSFLWLRICGYDVSRT